MPKKKRCSNVTQSIAPMPSIHRSLSSNDIEDGFSTLMNKKKEESIVDH